MNLPDEQNWMKKVSIAINSITFNFICFIFAILYFDHSLFITTRTPNSCRNNYVFVWSSQMLTVNIWNIRISITHCTWHGIEVQAKPPMKVDSWHCMNHYSIFQHNDLKQLTTGAFVKGSFSTNSSHFLKCGAAAWASKPSFPPSAPLYSSWNKILLGSTVLSP